MEKIEWIFSNIKLLKPQIYNRLTLYAHVFVFDERVKPLKEFLFADEISFLLIEKINNSTCFETILVNSKIRIIFYLIENPK